MDPGGDEGFDVVFDVSDDTERGGNHQQDQRYDRKHCGYPVSACKESSKFIGISQKIFELALISILFVNFFSHWSFSII